jgi:hypothetical protein
MNKGKLYIIYNEKDWKQCQLELSNCCIFIEK